MTLGFAAIFGLLGLGLWLASGRELPGIKVGHGGTDPKPGKEISRSIPSMVAFGAAYAIASLGCTIGPFLIISVVEHIQGELSGFLDRLEGGS